MRLAPAGHVKTRPRTSAMSIRIPFGLSLNVGGKSENIAKLMVCPAAAAPSIDTKKLLARFDADDFGLKLRLTWVQVVAVP